MTSALLPITQTTPYRIRNGIIAIAPTWLQGQWGSFYLATLGLMLDAISEWEREGVRARLPMDDGHPDGQLEQIGADRVIARGWTETDESYAQRLRQALLTWQRAGSAEAIMRALSTWWLPDAVATVAIPQGDNTNRWWYTLASYDAACAATRTTASASQWDWDGGATRWARIWVVAEVNETILPRKYIGAWTIGANTSIGANKPPQYFSGLRSLARTWKSAHTDVTVILSYNPTWPRVNQAPGPGGAYPDGTWDRPYLLATMASPRYGQALYLEPVS